MENKIFIPSFKIEKKTKAFNKYIWFFVFLLSCFTVSVLLGAFFYAFMTSLLKIVNNEKALGYIIDIPIALFILCSYQFYLFLQSLLVSYKFENGSLIKGKILKKNKVDLNDIAFDASFIASGISNLGDGSKTFYDITAINFHRLLQLIECNGNPNFVNQFFDTPIYKKVEYKNATLVKETKYSLIYTSDNKKKIVVPKIYDGMFDVPQSKESSFIKRIVKKTLCVFLIALVFISGLLIIQNKKNATDLNNIKKTNDVITQELDDYGYIANTSISSCIYRKDLDSEKTSTITYIFNHDGSIKKVELQLYYNDKSTNVENELYAILDSTGYDFSSSDKKRFIENVIKSINGDYTYDKLSTNNFSILIATSEGYIDIH